MASEFIVFLSVWNQSRYYKYLQIMKLLILLALVVLSTVAEDDGDWVDPFLLPIGFAVRGFYAGYLNVSSTKALYYVYTPSENNPSKDPLVVMISPGPGCSSLHSWLYSKGQFTFTRNTSNFRLNPHNWNKQANVLYIEGPAGVGYTIGVETDLNDNITQIEYFRALLRFYQKFPELKDQKMYLTGYGYAGIIAPKLAQNIFRHNADSSTPAWLKMNINGMLLFHPCTLAQECDDHNYFNQFTIRALRNHFFISKPGYENYKTYCTLRLEQCDAIEQKIESDFMITGADIHNLYQECLHQPGDYGCVDHIGIDIFLNLAAVKQDLNADTTKKWDLCNSSLSKNYQRDPDGSLKTYETLLREEFGRPPLKIWIVSGTQSALVPTHGTKRWIDELKLNLGLPNTRLWQPWFYNDINVGETEEMPGLNFITIRSAGFYMFEDQPQIAEYVYKSFLSGSSV